MKMKDHLFSKEFLILREEVKRANKFFMVLNIFRTKVDVSCFAFAVKGTKTFTFVSFSFSSKKKKEKKTNVFL
jgi:hypothetical protein